MSEPQPGPVPPPSLLHEPPAWSLLHEPPSRSLLYRPPDWPSRPEPPVTWQLQRPPVQVPPIQVPPARPPVAAPVRDATSSQERGWAVAAHLSGFLASVVALGFLGPLVVLITGGQRSAFVRRHAVEAINFNLSVLLWAVISGVLSLIVIGIPMLIGVGIMYLVASIVGAAAAGRGEEFRYPLTIRFVR
jgi:uncharacterized protein